MLCFALYLPGLSWGFLSALLGHVDAAWDIGCEPNIAVNHGVVADVNTSEEGGL